MYSDVSNTLSLSLSLSFARETRGKHKHVRKPNKIPNKQVVKYRVTIAPNYFTTTYLYKIKPDTQQLVGPSDLRYHSKTKNTV